jgi:hypothetical protein
MCSRTAKQFPPQLQVVTYSGSPVSNQTPQMHLPQLLTLPLSATSQFGCAQTLPDVEASHWLVSIGLRLPHRPGMKGPDAGAGWQNPIRPSSSSVKHPFAMTKPETRVPFGLGEARLGTCQKLCRVPAGSTSSGRNAKR